MSFFVVYWAYLANLIALACELEEGRWMILLAERDGRMLCGVVGLEHVAERDRDERRRQRPELGQNG